MNEPRARWSDERLDDQVGRIDKFETRVDARFNELEKRMDARFDHVDLRLDAINATLHSFQRSMIIALAGMLAAFGGALAAIQL